MFSLFQGVNTVQMCCAVVRSDFIHKYTMELSVVLTVLDLQHCVKRRRKEKERKRVVNNVIEVSLYLNKTNLLLSIATVGYNE